jgi:predicted O-methyltransferase YrrM
MNPELEERIKREIPADDSTSLGEKYILYWLIRETKPKVLVETGTHRGLTTMYMLEAMLQNGFGFLDTCDPNDEWGQLGNFRKFPEHEKMMKFHKQRGVTMLKGVKDVDFAFIDGFHGKEDVLPEIKELLPRLSKRAIVVFHDCWYGNTDGVNEALEEAGLQTVWLPTKNAIRIYSKHEPKPDAPV